MILCGEQLIKQKEKNLVDNRNLPETQNILAVWQLIRFISRGSCYHLILECTQQHQHNSVGVGLYSPSDLQQSQNKVNRLQRWVTNESFLFFIFFSATSQQTNFT